MKIPIEFGGEARIVIEGRIAIIHEDNGSTNQRLDVLTEKMNAVLAQGEHMSAGLDRVREEVEEAKTVGQSAIVLIKGLAQQIRDLKDDPVALAALADELDATNKAVAAEVVANTPSGPPVP